MKTQVIVVGAGPTGLMLANELQLAGVDAVVVEKQANRTAQSKALNLQPRTAEVLDMRGLLEPLLPKALGLIGDGHFAGLSEPLRYDGWETRRPYQVGIPQARTERHLEAQLRRPVLRGHAVTGVRHDEAGVRVQVSDHAEITADYLVACDGGRSTVRKLLGTPFPGRDPRMFAVVADVSVHAADEDLPGEWTSMRTLFEKRGTANGHLIPLEDGRFRLLIAGARQQTIDRDAPVTEDEVRDGLAEAYGDRVQLAELHAASRFSDANRQVERYRHGRVFYAGDAAHVHFPAGGQGLNLGVQDAVNLGWKLAATLHGRGGEELLDSYHDERHPVGAKVLHNTRAQGLLMAVMEDPDGIALRETLADLLTVPEANRHLAGMISGLAIRYPTECAHPLAGARMPDREVDGVRLYSLLHEGRGALVQQGNRGLDRFSDVVPVHTVADGLGAGAVLIRPDGYVCWASHAGQPDSGIEDALHRWFGATVTMASVTN